MTGRQSSSYICLSVIFILHHYTRLSTKPCSYTLILPPLDHVQTRSDQGEKKSATASDQIEEEQVPKQKKSKVRPERVESKHKKSKRNLQSNPKFHSRHIFFRLLVLDLLELQGNGLL